MMSITIRKELLFMIAAGIIVVYALIKLKKAARNAEKLFNFEECVRIMMFLYVIALVGITLFPVVIPPIEEPYQMDFVNWDIRNMFHFGSLRSLLVNIGGNVLMFVPLLPLVMLRWPKKRISFLGAASISMTVSATIEVLQYAENILGISDFPIRITDVSDLVLNFIGGMLGYGLIEFWKKFFEQKE